MYHQELLVLLALTDIFSTLFPPCETEWAVLSENIQFKPGLYINHTSDIRLLSLVAMVPMQTLPLLP